MSESIFSYEVNAGERFEFGKNWKRFLESLSEDQINKAIESLKNMFQLDTMEGKTFLDIGCGSGLFSLAAKHLGAKVVSFDYDPDSVACAKYLKSQFYSKDVTWEILTGSVLDTAFLGRLGQFDFLYSWGVLHHTGNMWMAIDNLFPLLSENALCFIAIYNEQPFFSKYWKLVKKQYNRSPKFLKLIIQFGYTGYFASSFFLADLLRKRNPMARYQNSHKRGMSVVCDVLDWIGGWPFEVAKPEAIIDYFHKKKCPLIKLTTCAGKHGCNEYVFSRHSCEGLR